MTLEWSVVSRSWNLLMEGTRITLGLFAVAIVLATALGLVLALFKLSPIPPLRWLSTAYVWVFRGTPVLVTLFFAFFVIGREFGLTPFWSGALGLGIDGAAYKAEIIRAGILAVDPGQHEAAEALGMTRAHSMRRIIVPQSIRVILPTYISNAILLLKATSIAVAIGVVELTGITRQLSNSTFQPIELFTAAAVIYLVLTSVLVVVQEILERRFVLKT